MVMKIIDKLSISHAVKEWHIWHCKHSSCVVIQDFLQRDQVDTVLTENFLNRCQPFQGIFKGKNEFPSVKIMPTVYFIFNTSMRVHSKWLRRQAN